ncbi:MAG: DUF389 domain-containing protein [Bryobacterales bacterium]|nr:DUF389 domain-containing protein [Bryobacterales bacterium]
MAETTGQNTRQRLEEFLRIDPRSKPRLYASISEAAEVASLNYWLELFFSAGIATLGLVLNSPAVVIGAMLISPLMGPILAAGLSLAVGDLYLGIKSAVNLITSIAAAVLFSSAIVWLLPFHSATNEILARTSPNLLDLGVAVFSGLAGSVVVFRGGGGGGVTALPGVAIAVALMPPLCTVGFGVGSGFLLPIISGAGLLFLTNLAAIIASAFLVFLAVKMDSADVRQEIDNSIRERASEDRLFKLLRRSFLAGSLADIGRLRWRVVMILLVLGVLFVPLSQALLEVRNETLARGAIREAIRTIAPRDAIVSEVVDLGAEQIRIRLILTEAIPPERVEQARNSILKRTGRDVDLFVRKVAGDDELLRLQERLSSPRVARDLEEVRLEMVARLEGPLQEVWPSDLADLKGYELGFQRDGVVVRVRYQSKAAFDEVTTRMLSRLLQNRLGLTDLHVDLQWWPPDPEPPVAAAGKPAVRGR